jgi:hypothetical protein
MTGEDVLALAASHGEWRRIFEAHVANIMRMRSLPGPEAEHIAFNNLVAEHLNAIHPDTDPSCCACCGRAETPDSVLLPTGIGERHTRLHHHCWSPWRERRRRRLAEAYRKFCSRP